MTNPSSWPPWLVQGNKVFVMDGNAGASYLATLKSNPYHSNEGVDVIDIQWNDRRDVVTVECPRCVSPLVDNSNTEPTSAATRYRSTRRPCLVKTKRQVTQDDFTVEADHNALVEQQVDPPMIDVLGDSSPPNEVIVRPSLKRAVSESTFASSSITTCSELAEEMLRNDDQDNGALMTDDITLQKDGDELNENRKRSFVRGDIIGNDVEGTETVNDELNSDDDDAKPQSSPPLWLHKGVKMQVLSGKNEPFAAKALTDPYHNGKEYVVRIKWSFAGYKDTVDCRRCRQSANLIEQGDESRKKRHCRAARNTNGSAHGKKIVRSQLERTRKKKAAPTILPESNMNGEGRAFAAAVDAREQLKQILLTTMPKKCRSPEVVDAALDKVGPPYGQNAVMAEIEEMASKGEPKVDWWDEPKQFAVKIGMQVRRIFQANKKPTIGTVVEKVKHKVENDQMELVHIWKVEYEDGDSEELEEKELRRYRYPAPILPPIHGRQLQFLELFGGSCVVSEAFREYRWKVASIDVDPNSNATFNIDIMKAKTYELPFVPDCIWCSPPCTTFSKLNGGRDRDSTNFDKTERARQHNDLLLKMFEILTWAKWYAPHLIVVIENPVGLLKKSPLMRNFTEEFGLHCTQVDYCHFGRDEKKPTLLWTNNVQLCHALGRFRCKEPFCDGVHMNVRGNAGRFDFSVIPQPLADFVAKWVDAKFVYEKIPYTKAVLPSETRNNAWISNVATESR